MAIEQAKQLIPEGYHPEMEKLLELGLIEEPTTVIVGLYTGLTAQIIYEAYGGPVILHLSSLHQNRHSQTEKPCPK